MHLDELLAQGTSQEIQDEVVALSEEFHIMTPYTSLLVLESDADRERFKVKKRFLMRDGEKFFAEGRDESQYQLVQQQMQRAGLWRIGLRNQVLQYFATLGRDRAQVEEAVQQAAMYDYLSLSDSLGREDLLSERYGFGGGMGGEFAREYSSLLGDREDLLAFDVSKSESFLGQGEPDFSKKLLPNPLPPLLDPKPISLASETPRILFSRPEPFGGEEVRAQLGLDLTPLYAGRSVRLNIGDPFGSTPMADAGLAFDFGYITDRRLRSSERRLKASQLFDELDESRAQAIDLVGALLPVEAPPVPAKAQQAAKRKSTWPQAAQALSRSLRAAVELTKLEGGLIVEEQVEGFDVHRQRLASRSQATRLVARDAWLTRSATDGGDVTFDWNAGGDRGAASLAYKLAVARKSDPADQLQEFDPGDWWQRDVEWHWQDYLVEIEQPAEGQQLLVMRHVLRPHEEVRLLIDTAKNTALSVEWREYGNATHSSRGSDLVEIGGVWLAQQIEDFDSDGRRTRLVTRKFTAEKPEAFAGRVKKELDSISDFLKLAAPLPASEAGKPPPAPAKGRSRIISRCSWILPLPIAGRKPPKSSKRSRNWPRARRFSPGYGCGCFRPAVATKN
jgi:hypothetical protein